MNANWIMVVAGIWAMISPWVLGFSSISIAKWNSLIIGLVMVILNIWIIFDDTNTDAENSGDEKEKGRTESKISHKS